jgi:DNA-binding transcriptional LysR family regulator
MDVRRLELLRELGERGSVTAVAKATHRTPSAVSQQIKVLEREIGFPLTEKRGRGVALTDAGKALARTATDIAVAIERASALWDTFVSAPAGEVSMLTFPTAGQMFMPVLLDVVAGAPELSLAASDRDPPLEKFASLTNDFDIVVAHSPNGARTWAGSGLHVAPLMIEPLDIALPSDHPLAEFPSLEPHQLVDETWIGVPIGFPFQLVMNDVERITGETPKISQRFSDTRITATLVASGHGIAVMPRYTSSDFSGVVLRPLNQINPVRHISALARRDRVERPSVRLVIEILQREAARISGSHPA